MSDVSVDYDQLHLASELLDRQGEHVENMRGHLQTYCRIPSGSFGLLLQILHPINELVVDTADQGLKLLESMSTWSATSMTSTLDAYIDSDQAVYEQARTLALRLGVSLPPFSDPRGSLPALGAARSSAPENYGQRHRLVDPGMDSGFHLGQTVRSGGELVGNTARGAIDRATTLGSRGGVTERTDPSSYLVAPDMTENFVEELRWKAGVILGSVDWVAEQFLGYSVLEEFVFKPFGGDWHAIGAATQAWQHTDRALMETGSNFSGLPGQVDSWTSEASVAFLGAMTGMSAAAVAMSGASGFVSSLMAKVATVAKLTCSIIATLLRKISDKLLRIAAEAAIPVAGWIAAAVEVVILVGDAIAITGMIKSAIDTLIDVIADFISGREKLVQALFIVEDLVTAAANKAVRL